MLSPEFLTKLYRGIKSRRPKALAIKVMQLLGMRYLVIRIDTTNLCNLRCRMCYYSAEKHRKRVEMDMSLFEKIAKEIFPHTKFLYLSCATEPLMNRNFVDFLKCVGKYNVPFTSFCTNGMLLDENIIIESINSRISEIIFSVDGATPETYEYIRRGASWDTLLDKLELLKSMKERARSTLPVVRINFTCMKRNIEELPAMMKFAADHGVSNVHVRHLLAFDSTDDEMLSDEQMEYRKVFNEIARKTRAEADRLGIKLFLPDVVPEKTKQLNDGADSSKPKRREANPYCMVPWFEGIITPAGDYRLCSAFPPFGNLKEQSFEEIYNSPRMQQLRRKLLQRSPDACSWTCRQEAYDVEPVENNDNSV